MRLTSRALTVLSLTLIAACGTPRGDTAQDPVEPTPEFEIVALEHADAEELAQTLEAFIADASATIDGTEPDQDAVPKVLSDPRTNSLLIMASESQMVELKTLIVKLDTEQN